MSEGQVRISELEN